MLLSERFMAALGQSSAQPEILDEVPEDSVCGRGCVQAIAAGEKLCDHVIEAFGDDSEYLDQIASLVEDICVTYIRG